MDDRVVALGLGLILLGLVGLIPKPDPERLAATRAVDRFHLVLQDDVAIERWLA